MKAFRLILLIFIPIVCVARTQPAQAAPVNAGKIAFMALDSDDPASTTLHIYTINPDGSAARSIYSKAIDPHEIPECGKWDCSLDWSPDYKYLRNTVRWSDSKVGEEIIRTATVVVSADGSGDKRFNNDYTEFKWSPDGKYLAYLYKKGRSDGDSNLELYLASADGSSPQRFAGIQVTDYAWSRDGTQLTLSSLGTIYTVKVEGQTKLVPLTTNDVAVNGLHWTADGKMITFVYRMGLYSVDIKTRTRDKKFSDMPRNYGWLCCVWSSSQDKLFSTGYETWGEILDISSGSATALPGYAINLLHSVKWSPDGSEILYQGGPTVSPTIWKGSSSAPETPQLTGERLKNSGNSVWLLDGRRDVNFGDKVWSPDGKDIAFVLGEKVLGTQICVYDRAATNLNCITELGHYGDQGVIQLLAWAATGEDNF